MIERSPLKAFLLFVVAAFALAAGVAVVGSGVAQERFGLDSAQAWLAGCGVSFVASLVAGVVVWIMTGAGVSGVTVALGSMLLRLVVLVLLGGGVVALMGVALRPFLLAVAASYLALLVVDTAYALAAARAPAG